MRLPCLVVLAGLVAVPTHSHAQMSLKDAMPMLNAGQPNPEFDFEEYLKLSRTKHGLLWTKWAVRPQDSCPVRIHVASGNQNDDSRHCLKSYTIQDGPSSSEFVFVLNDVIYTFYSNAPLPNDYVRGGRYTLPVASASQGPRRHVPGPAGLRFVRWAAHGTCQIARSFTQDSLLTCSADDGKVAISVTLTSRQ